MEGMLWGIRTPHRHSCQSQLSSVYDKSSSLKTKRSVEPGELVRHKEVTGTRVEGLVPVEVGDFPYRGLGLRGLGRAEAREQAQRRWNCGHTVLGSPRRWAKISEFCLASKFSTKLTLLLLHH